MIWKGIFPLRNTVLQSAIQLGVRNLSVSRVLRKDHYEVLGIKRDATQAEIKNAYFELSKIYHPDRIAATDENLAKFREISTAYEILGNEQSRRLYDRGLLGDDKKVGLEETDDPVDPIVKFYKQRHQKSKITEETSEDMDVWTEKFYREIRTQAHKKNELFKGQKSKVPVEDMNEHLYVLIGVWLIVAIGFALHIEDHPFREFMLSCLGESDK